MLALFLLLALLLVLVGHAFRLLRWEQFIRIYERPPRGQMLRGMAGGYALNFVLPFHLGDAFRAVYTGRKMKSGIGFALDLSEIARLPGTAAEQNGIKAAQQ